MKALKDMTAKELIEHVEKYTDCMSIFHTQELLDALASKLKEAITPTHVIPITKIGEQMENWHGNIEPNKLKNAVAYLRERGKYLLDGTGFRPTCAAATDIRVTIAQEQMRLAVMREHARLGAA